MYRQLSRFSFPTLVGLATAALASCGRLRPDRALAVAPNLVSHQLCSAIFVAGQAGVAAAATAVIRSAPS